MSALSNPKRPLTIDINGEPEDVARFMELMMPRGPSEADKALADKLWPKKRKTRARSQ